jgi:hypothetical protein
MLWKELILLYYLALSLNHGYLSLQDQAES